MNTLSMTINGVTCVDNAPCDMNPQAGAMLVQQTFAGYAFVGSSFLTGNVLDTTWSVNALKLAGGTIEIRSETNVDVSAVEAAIGGTNHGGSVTAITGDIDQGPFAETVFNDTASGSASGNASQYLKVTVGADGVSTGDLQATLSFPPVKPPEVPPSYAALVPTLDLAGLAMLILGLGALGLLKVRR